MVVFSLSWFDFLSQCLENYIIFLIATFVQFYIGKDFYISSFNALKNKIADMNLLIVIGTSTAYFYSTLVLFFPNIFPQEARNLYFESSVAIITFLLLGKYLEEKARNKSSSFIKNLLKLKAKKAIVLVDNKEVLVDADSIVEGDLVILKEGDKVPVDAIVVKGKCEVDNSSITGEYLPVVVEENGKLISGAVVKSGYCIAKAITSGKNSTVNQIIDYILKSQNQKPKISKLADKIVYYFVPTVLIISIIVFDIWYLFTEDLQKAIISSVSVLIIACPCALGLATPIAVVSSVGRLAKEKILLKNGDILESINEIKYVVFDKTGTLTEGKLKLVKYNLNNVNESLIKEIVSKSSHPISISIKDAFSDIKEKGLIKNFEIRIGKGIVAKTNDENIVLIGNEKLLDEFNIKLTKEFNILKNKITSKGKLIVFVAINKQLDGYFILEDKIKPNAREIINWLKQSGYKVGVLSGDNKNVVEYLKNVLNLDFAYAEILPKEKGEIIKNLQKSGGVMFIGDGINDAIAIRFSNIGVAVHKGTYLAKEAGDVVLLNDNLVLIKKLILLLKFSNKVIKENLTWAYIYNIVGIPIAGGILYPIFDVLLKPVFAGIAMSLSSISVVLNALRIQIKNF